LPGPLSADTRIPFQHFQSAHCESGVTANLLRHQGLPLTEPLAFGIGSGLFFFYLSFIKMGGYPLTSFRYTPGYIFRRATKMLGVRVETRHYRDPEKAMRDLDEMLDAGRPVGLQVGVYWLPFFPDALRFHFNAHNIVVFGREGGEYLVSDPTFPEPVACPRAALQKARFARGILAPRGRMYFPVSVPAQPDFPRAILAGIRKTCYHMLGIPLPFLGVKGIRYLARHIRQWPRKMSDLDARLYLAQVIRMQEEIGTGGAGFRFVYAAFLQEAAALLCDASVPHATPLGEELQRLSRDLTATGDRWREFALLAARICKGRATPNETFDAAADILLDCANREERCFRELKERVG
jgi:hypothetical protein